MKKLLKKLLAVVLAGAMLGSVACNDYDDEINDVNNRIDELEGKVAMKADLDALQATVNQLAAIDFDSFATDAELNAAIAKCASKDDIKNFLSSDAINTLIANAVADMQKQIEALKSDLEGQIGATNQALAGLQAQFEAFDAWTAVQEQVNAAIAEALKPYLLAEDAVTMEQVNAAIAEAVKDALTVEDVNDTIKAWMGENFAKLMEPYEAEMEQALAAAIKAREEADAALKSDLEKQLEEAITAVKDAQAGNKEAADKAVEELNAKIAELTKQIEELEKKAADDDAALEARLNEKLEAANTALEALKAAHAADKAAADAAIAALEKQIADAADKAAEDHAALQAELTKLQEADKTLKAELTKALEDAVAASDKAVEAVYVELEAIKTALTDYEKRIAAVEEAVKNLDQAVKDLEDKVNALIQNIAFVPEYADGLATAINLVPLKDTDANTLSATMLTAVFEITPAESAAKIVKMMESEAQEVSMKIQPLKSRAGELKVLDESKLTIESVEGAEGRIKVTAKVPDMDKDYNSYQFALCVKTDLSEASSDYEDIFVKQEATFSYVWAAKDKTLLENSAAWVENPFEDYKNGENAIAGWINYDVKFTKVHSPESRVKLLGDYELMVKDEAGKLFTTAEVEAQYGAAEGSLAPKQFTATWCGAYSEGAMYQYVVPVGGETAEPLEVKMAANTLQAASGWVNNWTVFCIESVDATVPAAYACYTITGPEVEETAETTTFHVVEAGDLYWMSKNIAKYTDTKLVVEFAEGAEIDFSKVEKADGGEDSYWDYAPIKLSNGPMAQVNGNGATIKNLTYNKPAVEYAGVFGEVVGNIDNLKVVDSDITGNHYVAAVAGHVHGNITNCVVENTNVTAVPNMSATEYNGDKVGAIVGYLAGDDEAGTSCYAIENCVVNNVKVTGFRDAGGLVGCAYVNDEALIKNNTVTDATIVADQRAYLYPNYKAAANVGLFVGRQMPEPVKKAYDYAATNNVATNSTATVRIANGAEINVLDEKKTLELTTPFGLAWFSNNVLDERFTDVAIAADIDFAGKLTFEDSGLSQTFLPISNKMDLVYRLFDFDGRNHTISNLTITDPYGKDLALFGEYCGDIKNVKLDNAKITGLGRVAGIGAKIWGQVDNCHVTNSTFKAAIKTDVSTNPNDWDGDKVGAIVAQMQADGVNGEVVNNKITNCSVDGVEIFGFRDLGAVAGHAELVAWDGSNKVTNTKIWIDHVTASYGDHKPFDTAAAYVGRGERKAELGIPAEAPEADNVTVYSLVKSNNYTLVENAEGHLGMADEAAMIYFQQNYKNYNGAFLFDDITLTGEWTPIAGSASNDWFDGTFDGKGHTIEGLKVTTRSEYSGLFGCVNGSIKNVKIVNPEIVGNHWAAALVAVMYGSVEGCEVNGGKIILTPNQVNGTWDNGDKAGALVGYLAASGVGNDKVVNNTVTGVTVKAFRDVAALVGCANNIDEMSGNVAKDNAVIIDVLTGYYEGESETIGKLIGRLDNDTDANVKNNDSATTTLYRLTESGTETLADQVDINREL